MTKQPKVLYTSKFIPARNDWKNVEDFKNMWGFLPSDDERLQKLSKSELIHICMCGMTTLAQGNSQDIAIRKIKVTLSATSPYGSTSGNT